MIADVFFFLLSATTKGSHAQLGTYFNSQTLHVPLCV